MTNKLKLYVWENTLCVYTSGIMFALAYDEKEARRLIKETDPDIDDSDFREEAIVITNPRGFTVWGGG